MGSKLTPRRNSSGLVEDRTAGFTLIELMVVVTVLSILAVGAGLVASRGGKSSANSDMQRFYQQIEIARARAVQGRQVQGLYITARGFQTSVRTDANWEKPTGKARWRGRVTLQLRTPRLGPNSPHIVLLPDGRVSAFTLSFAPTGGQRTMCRSDGHAGVTCGQG